MPSRSKQLFLELDELDFQKALDNTLRELREILHRRGRLSSRNEALDELCKLLFAHIMSIAHGGKGISKGIIVSQNGEGQSSTASLRKFVHEAFDRHLPFSLSHEINHADFDLRIRPQENLLADEVIDCFERLAPKVAEQISSIDNVDVYGGPKSQDKFDPKIR